MRSRKLDVAADMPPKFHKLPGQNFSLEKSEVVQWLCNRRDVQQFIFDVCVNNELIIFDPETRMWHGADYFAEETEQKEDTGAKWEW